MILIAIEAIMEGFHFLICKTGHFHFLVLIFVLAGLWSFELYLNFLESFVKE